MPALLKRSIAEFFGTALLVCVVVGSGIMGTSLSGDEGIALVINALSTAFALALLIFVVGPISGAHFNPVVTLVEAFSRNIKDIDLLAYIPAQIFGAVAGSITANAMFNQTAIQISTQNRANSGALIGEVIATAGLIALIGILSKRGQGTVIPVAVAGWIGSAYFFTSSTSFANPAVTIGRVFTDTFAGIEPGSVLPFVAAQLVGAALGFAIAKGVSND
ncbi:MIP/aquaporin family protein [Rhodoluna sp.]|uniref:aquaporin n=1 Tax=Rhodoluna sp. TaxID=1969481 RepID=UPI0025EE5EDF|nr:MIP/aquaporin family protein [Rhodoluna sp.]